MIADRVRNFMRSFLRIEPPQHRTITITEQLDYNVNAARNRIWYRGEAEELSELYKQLPCDRSSFWSAVPTKGMEIRKIHTGLPRLITDVLTSITLADMNEIELPEEITPLWEEIALDNNFDTLMSKALTQTLYIGDGAFKISIDEDISQYPILEFYSGDRVEFISQRGRIREVIFKTEYICQGTRYILNEIYGFGYVYYKLYRDEAEVPLSAFPQTANLNPVIFDKSYCMAVPFRIFAGNNDRGKSIFDGKTGSFDSLDEVWSQWMHALRMSRPMKYLPPNLVPKNPFTGESMLPNAFDNTYIQTEGGMPETGGETRAELIQPQIPHDSYLSAYITALDLCLQGIVSPSTLGIDTKKLDNAEAQREKEKTTLYTRNKIVKAIQTILPKLIQTVFKVYGDMTGKDFGEFDIDIPFGEYANPSFESQVETVGKGRTQGIMSIEACVDELYGDTKDDKWKAAEVERIKAEQGVQNTDEPLLA